MIYLRMRGTVHSQPGQSLHLCDVADVLADASLKLQELPIDTPRKRGVWSLEAMPVIARIQQACPSESVILLGSATGTLVCEPQHRTRGTFWRSALVCALLFVGSAMAIAWFHADVNMLDAQRALVRMVTGQEAQGTWWVTLPYALGVGSGVAFYYALIGRKTVSPLDIKLTEYRQQAQEQMLRESDEQPRG